MLKDLSEKIDNQNESLKNLSKCLETISFIIKNSENKDDFSDLKNRLKDLKPVLTNLENNLTDLENLLPISNTNPDEEQICDNNTLLISEVQNKVVLPYTLTDLQEILNTSKDYTNFKEVIDKVYTISIDYYKNSPLSRFKETYNLMRNKEKASILESLNLALEVSLYFSLNPAIITACKTLDQLDTYLECLFANELDKFDLFNIKYEILPYK